MTQDSLELLVNLTDLDAYAREQFYIFVQRAFEEILTGTYEDNWHIEALCFELQECFEGRQRRLMINLCPRSLKSFIASVCFVAWVLGRNPKAKFLCISYGEDLARVHSQQTKQLMESDFYRRVFPGTLLSPIDNTITRFWTTAGGGRRAVSIDGSITGHGADYILIDDPTKADEALSLNQLQAANESFDRTIFNRQDNLKTGVIILVMQRLGQADMTGHLLARGGYRHIRIPLVAEQRETYRLYGEKLKVREPGELMHAARADEKELKDLRYDESIFQCQYQQNPVPRAGAIFVSSMFKYYKERGRESFRFQSWDVASSTSAGADFSVCHTWDVIGDDFYLVDAWAIKCHFTDLTIHAKQLEAKYAPDTIVCEVPGVGQPLYDTLFELFGSKRVESSRPLIPKVDRAYKVVKFMSRVYLPADAPWLSEFRNELLAFPRGVHDDHVDAMTQFLLWAPKLMMRVTHNGVSQIHRRHPDPENPNSGNDPSGGVAPAARRRLRYGIGSLERHVKDHFGAGW